MKRTFVYVDGFNLYDRALRKTRFKWLNIEALVQGLLEVDNVIEKIRYFTAPVSGKLDPSPYASKDTWMRSALFPLSPSIKATS